MFSIEDRVRPILKWAGGKSGLLPQLIKHFPSSFSRFVEPFIGGGAVFFALKPEVPALINDSNHELTNLYTVVRDAPEQLMAALDALAVKYSEDFYYQLRSSSPSNVVEQTARTVFLNKTGFNGLYRQNSKGDFNVPFGKRLACPQLYDRDNILRASLHLKSTEIQSVDFEGILNSAGKGDFVYCDPPYEPLSQTSSFNAYKGNGFSQDDQRRLRDAAARAAAQGAFVAISNSTADFIMLLYKDWDLRGLFARRAINSKGSGRGAIPEVLIVKVPSGEASTKYGSSKYVVKKYHD